MRQITTCVSLALLFCTTACNYIISPITTTPAAVLGIYEKSEKRENWLNYAKEGDVYAQYELGQSYCCSKLEGSVDYAESYKWFCTAAKNGYSRAQIKIASYYEDGKKLPGLEVSQDKMLAYYWYGKASMRINEDGRQGQKRLKRFLKEDELKLVQNMLKSPEYLDCMKH